jgi:intracellular septation protein A
MLEFFRFYFMAGVYIAAAVLAVSAIVALIEKLFGLNQTPPTVNLLNPTVRRID